VRWPRVVLVIIPYAIDYKDGERGRNRTYNLLMERQLNQINGFSDFRAFQVGSLRQ
jgi:hypothetical protein